MKSGIHSGYLESCFSESAPKNVIKQIKKNLNGVEYDGFLVQGLSGIIMGTIVSRALRKKLVVARKGEKTHGMLIENIMEDDILIILDDFCSSGATIRKIFKTMKTFKMWVYGKTDPPSQYRNPHVKVLGAVFYNRGCVFVPGSDSKSLVINCKNIREKWNPKRSEWNYMYSC